MTSTAARRIADEQIAFWRRQDVSAEDAWRSMGLPWGWGAQWREVRLEMMRWLLTGGEH